MKDCRLPRADGRALEPARAAVRAVPSASRDVLELPPALLITTILLTEIEIGRQLTTLPAGRPHMALAPAGWASQQGSQRAFLQV